MPITTREGLLEEWYNKMYMLRCYFAGETPISPIPLPDVTTVDGMLEGIANEADGSLIALAKSAGIYHDYDEAYMLQLPSKLYRWYGVKKIGGRTVVWNQLNRLSQSTGTVNDVTFTLDKDALTVTCSGTASAKASKSVTSYASVSGHVYYLKGCPQGGAVDKYWMDTSTGTGEDTGNGFVFTSTHNGTRYIVCRIGNGVDATGVVFKPILIDLTLMFGAGNEPTTAAECNAMFPKDFYAYTTRKLLSAGVTAIVSKDANNDPIETITIPAEIQTLTGYGMSCPNNVNYIDFETQKFCQYVGSRAYTSGDDSDATVITDGTTTHYPLDTPVETSISLSVDNMQYAEGGTITFENQTDCNIPVRIDVEYIA